MKTPMPQTTEREPGFFDTKDAPVNPMMLIAGDVVKMPPQVVGIVANCLYTHTRGALRMVPAKRGQYRVEVAS